MRSSLIIASLIILALTTLHAADLKVGHFDLQRLIAQSEAGIYRL